MKQLNPKWLQYPAIIQPKVEKKVGVRKFNLLPYFLIQCPSMKLHMKLICQHNLLTVDKPHFYSKVVHSFQMASIMQPLKWDQDSLFERYLEPKQIHSLLQNDLINQQASHMNPERRADYIHNKYYKLC